MSLYRHCDPVNTSIDQYFRTLNTVCDAQCTSQPRLPSHFVFTVHEPIDQLRSSIKLRTLRHCESHVPASETPDLHLGVTLSVDSTSRFMLNTAHVFVTPAITTIGIRQMPTQWTGREDLTSHPGYTITTYSHARK